MNSGGRATTALIAVAGAIAAAKPSRNRPDRVHRGPCPRRRSRRSTRRAERARAPAHWPGAGRRGPRRGPATIARQPRPARSAAHAVRPERQPRRSAADPLLLEQPVGEDQRAVRRGERGPRRSPRPGPVPGGPPSRRPAGVSAPRQASDDPEPRDLGADEPDQPREQVGIQRVLVERPRREPRPVEDLLRPRPVGPLVAPGEPPERMPGEVGRVGEPESQPEQADRQRPAEVADPDRPGRAQVGPGPAWVRACGYHS